MTRVFGDQVSAMMESFAAAAVAASGTQQDPAELARAVLGHLAQSAAALAWLMEHNRGVAPNFLTFTLGDSENGEPAFEMTFRRTGEEALNALIATERGR